MLTELAQASTNHEKQQFVKNSLNLRKPQMTIRLSKISIVAQASKEKKTTNSNSNVLNLETQASGCKTWYAWVVRVVEEFTGRRKY